jgi:transposase-like protein
MNATGKHYTIYPIGKPVQHSVPRRHTCREFHHMIRVMPDGSQMWVCADCCTVYNARNERQLEKLVKQHRS